MQSWQRAFYITPGMRVAQAVVAKVTLGKFLRFEELAETVRGENGFGHTGTQKMPTFDRYLSPDMIFFIKSQDRDDAIRQLVLNANKAQKIDLMEEFYTAVIIA